jgi:hypothetical protein
MAPMQQVNRQNSLRIGPERWEVKRGGDQAADARQRFSNDALPKQVSVGKSQISHHEKEA